MEMVRRFWWGLEEPPEWTSAMCVLYVIWAAVGVLLARGVTMLPGAEAGVTALLSGLLTMGGALAAPSTIWGARWSERIGNVLVQLAFAVGLVVLVVTRDNWTHLWFAATLALFATSWSMFALRMTHIMRNAYRPGSRGAKSAKGAASRRESTRGTGNTVGDAGPRPGS